MLYLVDDEGMTRNYAFTRELNIVEDTYSVEPNIFVRFIPDMRKQDGTKVRGGYALGLIPTTKGAIPAHIVYIDSDCDVIEAATVLVHEYAHILSQQDHGFVMYELWREYLREQFKRRWHDVIEQENRGDDRGRVIVVGEVRSDGTDEHLQE